MLDSTSSSESKRPSTKAPSSCVHSEVAITCSIPCAPGLEGASAKKRRDSAVPMRSTTVGGGAFTPSASSKPQEVA
eukprot:6829329-Prymnesium_polylepis.2